MKFPDVMMVDAASKQKFMSLFLPMIFQFFFEQGDLGTLNDWLKQS